MISNESRTCWLMDVCMYNPLNHTEDVVKVFIPKRIYDMALAKFIRKTYHIEGADDSIIALVMNFNGYEVSAIIEDDMFLEICRDIWMSSKERIEDYAEWMQETFDIDYYHDKY